MKKKIKKNIKRFLRKIKKLLRNERSRKKIIFISVVSAGLLWFFWGLPLPTRLGTGQLPVSTKILDRNGNLIYEIYSEKRRTPVKLEDLPDYIKQATIAIEDKDFYKHHGFSITGMIRAAYKIVFKRKLEGGSTLTQQLVKNALLTPERTIRRKVREFVLTMLVETIYPKDRILEMYLNQIPYGSTAYGIETASELYFGKSAKNLSLAEATFLAGLPKAPSRYSPFGSHPELAKSRQETVLKRMVEEGYIKKEEADETAKNELSFKKPEAPKAPHFALWIKEQLAEKYGERVVEQGGLRVTTTLDLELQEFTQQMVATEVGKLKKHNVGNGAVLVTRPKTGEILAMVGSKDYFAQDEDGKVNIIFAKRQPGSSIKPLNYALAFMDEKITPATPLADVPTCFSVPGQPVYCPRNYDFKFHGNQQARFALGNSFNLPAVRVLALNGIKNFVGFAKDMGITTFKDPSNYGLSLTLGGGEVMPYDMAVAFGVFANQGIKQPLISILKVEDWKGNTLKEIKLDDVELTGDRVLEPSITFLINHILLDNNARAATFGESSYLNVRGHPEVSVKTGTTNDLRDNWTIGYTEHALVVSWVGNNDNSSMSGAVSGVSGASPIWNKTIREVLNKAEDGFYNKKDEGHAWPRQPSGVVGATACSDTGNLTAGEESPENQQPGCPTRFEYFLEDTVGSRIETGSKDLQIDKTTGALAGKDTPPENIEIQNHPFLVDPLGTLVCLNCPIPTQNVTIGYPIY